MKFFQSLKLSAPCCHCERPCWDFLCKDCEPLYRLAAMCKACGRAPIAKVQELCLSCQSRSFPWNYLSISFIYRSRLKKWMESVKNRSFGLGWSEIKHRHLPPLAISYDWVVPVSSDPQKLRSRLFDNSEAFARRLGKLWKLPVRLGLFRRKAFMESQKSLGRRERLKFLKELVRLESLEGQRLGNVLLVDDIVTSGASLECHAELLKPYTTRIDVYCFARAPAFFSVQSRAK